MKRIALVVALIVAVVVILVLLLRPKGKAPEPAAMAHPALWHEAVTGVSPDTLGPAWPDDPFIERVRAQWGALGFRDSTVCEEMVRVWIYPAAKAPKRLTNVRLTPTGRDMSIADRLALGERFLAHPGWRMGSARFFPVAAVVLSSTEKATLAALAGRGNTLRTADALGGEMGVSVDVIREALDALASVGWVATSGEADSLLYRAPDPTIAGSPALQFVSLREGQSNPRDFVTVRAALESLKPPFSEATFILSGPCVQTGRLVSMQLTGGQLRRGRPGNAWAADVSPPGLSDGLFVSQRAFDAWRTAHPGAEIGFEGSVVTMYHGLVEGRGGR
jgi:hypothetical protein